MDQEIEDFEDLDDFEEQVEQLVLENGILLHAVVNLLVKNGVISREDLDGEIEKLYQQAEEGLAEEEADG